MRHRDQDATGHPLPDVGTHVICRRVSDNERKAGVIDENVAGLFLTCDDGTRTVLCSSLWDVVVAPRTDRPDPVADRIFSAFTRRRAEVAAQDRARVCDTAKAQRRKDRT